jgi:RNA polymerase sigma-70 factor (ECF subfamily)
VYPLLLQEHQGYLERIALALLGNRSDAQDALQEAAYLGYRQQKQLKGGEAAFRPWMRQILVRECLRILRHRQRTLPVADLSSLLPDEAPGPDPDATLIWAQVGQLADHLRTVIVMRYLLDWSQEQIAAELRIPLGTVKSRIGKALALLRAMQTEENAPGIRSETKRQEVR